MSNTLDVLRTLLVRCLFCVRALETCSISSVFHQKQGTWRLNVTILSSKMVAKHVGFDKGSDLSEFLWLLATFLY